MEENELNTEIGLPNDLISELKAVYKTMHPTQFVFDVARKMKKEDPTYIYGSDDTYAYKCTCVFDATLRGEGYNNQKKESKSN